jgi:prepilin-type N-terminal cleavage/methylation domain-containing protein
MKNVTDIQNKNTTSGFTLIEIMVATSIFIIIMLSVMSGLISSADASKRARGLQEAMDNVNFAMDSMSRTLRISTHYSCVNSFNSNTLPSPSDCPLDGSAPYGTLIAFVPPLNLGISSSQYPAVAYRIYNRGDGTWGLQRCGGVGSSCIDMVSSSVSIDMLRFFVDGSSPTDTIQPSVYIIMKGTVTVKGVPTSFAIQTDVSQRSSDQ